MRITSNDLDNLVNAIDVTACRKAFDEFNATGLTVPTINKTRYSKYGDIDFHYTWVVSDVDAPQLPSLRIEIPIIDRVKELEIGIADDYCYRTRS